MEFFKYIHKRKNNIMNSNISITPSFHNEQHITYLVPCLSSSTTSSPLPPLFWSKQHPGISMTILRMSDLWEQDFLKYDLQETPPEKSKIKDSYSSNTWAKVRYYLSFWRVALYINVLVILRNLHVTTYLNQHLPSLIESGTLISKWDPIYIKWKKHQENICNIC